MEHPGDLNRSELVARPGELYQQLDAAQVVAGLAPQTPSAEQAAARKAAWLVRLPAGASLGWEQVRELNRHGYTLASRQVAAHPPADAMARQEAVGSADARERRLMTVATTAAMALLEVALLAGPAFAVGARRARRQLALLGAVGGRPGHVRAVVLGGGLVLGAAGAALGAALGAGLVAVLRTPIEEWGGSRFGQLTLRPSDLAAILAVGVVTALLAALLPALQAGRREVLDGLTDRDPVRRSGRWTPLLGLAAVLAGAALALYGAVLAPTGGMPVLAGLSTRTLSVLTGATLAELGLLLFTPALLALLGRLARLLPVGPRLALRDAARHRSRTGPRSPRCSPPSPEPSRSACTPPAPRPRTAPPTGWNSPSAPSGSPCTATPAPCRNCAPPSSRTSPTSANAPTCTRRSTCSARAAWAWCTPRAGSATARPSPTRPWSARPRCCATCWRCATAPPRRRCSTGRPWSPTRPTCTTARRCCGCRATARRCGRSPSTPSWSSAPPGSATRRWWSRPRRSAGSACRSRRPGRSGCPPGPSPTRPSSGPPPPSPGSPRTPSSGWSAATGRRTAWCGSPSAASPPWWCSARPWSPPRWPPPTPAANAPCSPRSAPAPDPAHRLRAAGRPDRPARRRPRHDQRLRSRVRPAALPGGRGDRRAAGAEPRRRAVGDGRAARGGAAAAGRTARRAAPGRPGRLARAGLTTGTRRRGPEGAVPTERSRRRGMARIGRSAIYVVV
ncbi:triacylglycerol lipase [Kitasatospora cheerisanensis KCTC 2395]|uniref:Triacylglycerol lipase n=1 Tax=Kitasatospora cheerisanensis KCTC 2395 TaxID=1348663 RepID=A0A066YQC3_9ACTN|nr:triacylglycerol lipase [Kitasatospora cheerisanensis KCTC 2395]